MRMRALVLGLCLLGPSIVVSACGRTDLEWPNPAPDASDAVVNDTTRDVASDGLDARESGPPNDGGGDGGIDGDALEAAIDVDSAATDDADGAGDAVVDVAVDAGPPICGNGRREGLEGCDDGNDAGGDGCRADCVIEGNTLGVLLDLAGTGEGAFALAATPSGIVYVEAFTLPTRIHRIGVDGTLTKNVVPDLRVTYPSYSLVAVGENLVIGGEHEQGGRHSELYAWQASSGTTTMLYSEQTPNALISHTAIDLGFSRTVYSDQISGLRRVTGAAATTSYAATGALRIAGRPPIPGRPGGIVALTGTTLLADDGDGNFELLYTYVPSGQEMWWNLAVDGEGTTYVSCLAFSSNLSSGGCASGTIWAVDANGTDARPFVDSFGGVFAMTWNPAKNELLLGRTSNASVLEPRIVRVPLAR